MIHYFIPSEKDKDVCKRCGKNFRNTDAHVTDKTDALLIMQAHFNGRMLDLENIDVHRIDEPINPKL